MNDGLKSGGAGKWVILFIVVLAGGIFALSQYLPDADQHGFGPEPAMMVDDAPADLAGGKGPGDLDALVDQVPNISPDMLGRAFQAPPQPISPAAQAANDLHHKGQYKAALAAWENLAAQGDREGQYRLGKAYLDGIVIGRDYRKSLELLTKASEQGHSAAQFDLGSMYDGGLGVRPNVAEAYKWYLAAANRGRADAQFNVGSMYEEGVVVAQDPIQAYKWYSLSAQQGFVKFSLPRLAHLTQVLSAEQLEQAITLTKAFQQIQD